MTRKKHNLPEGDDGRTIAGMNVEGMPWYTPEGQSARGRKQSPEAREEPALTGRESRYYTWGALKAALLVVGVMCGGIILFVWFCVGVWFR